MYAAVCVGISQLPTHYNTMYTVHLVVLLMSLIHYSLMPFILYLVPFTVGLLLQYLSFANGAGGVDIFKLYVFQCFVVKQLH